MDEIRGLDFNTVSNTQLCPSDCAFKDVAAAFKYAICFFFLFQRKNENSPSKW